uniref:Lipocalin-like domain-containing protein n=1 Tax=Loa loa TaxID=7209 RepID=A0A1I7VB89_LOALO
MAKLIVYLAFFICCQAAGQNAAGPGGVNGAAVAEVITDYKADKLWEDGRLIVTTKVEECTFILYRIDL